MIAIPAMDIIDSSVVRLSQGDYKRRDTYNENPLELAEQFAHAGIKKLHLVDLSGAKESRPVHADLFSQIKKKTGVSVEAGGGIRSFEHVDTFFKAGLKKGEDEVMIGSLPFLNRPEFDRILEQYRESVLLTVDVWGESVKISGWQQDTEKDIYSFIEEMLEAGIEKFLVTQIKKDGMLTGPDIALYQSLLKKFPQIRLTASGGVSSIEDLEKLSEKVNADSVIVGRAFYENRISIEQMARFT